MKRVLVLAFLAAALNAAARGEPGSATYYRPGQWVEVRVPSQCEIVAPAATTVVGTERAEAQYVIPMSAPWTAIVGDLKLDASAMPDGAWLAAELDGSAGGKSAARDGILRALPKGSVLAPLGDVRRGVPEQVDLIICYDFSESKLQPQERAAVTAFVRRGGAVFLIFASRIPAASVEFWRELFGAEGAAEEEAMGLPRDLRVPAGFTLRFDETMPRLVWQQCGRGIALAYGLPSEKVLEDRDETAKLFERATLHIREVRQPVALGPVEPDVFALFGPPEWSEEPRRRFAFMACGYSAAAIGLMVSFAGLLARRRLTWLAGALCIAAGGGAVLAGLTASSSGLALDTAAMVIQEPDTDPVEVVFARISRIGPGVSPQFRSAASMPPKPVLYSRYSAAQKNWLNYRFLPAGSTVEPLLDAGQSLCLASVRTVSQQAADETASPPALAAAPANADKLVSFFNQRWARKGTDYTFRWVRPFAGPRLFDVSADDDFVQVHGNPVLVVTGSKKPAPIRPSPATPEAQE